MNSQNQTTITIRISRTLHHDSREPNTTEPRDVSEEGRKEFTILHHAMWRQSTRGGRRPMRVLRLGGREQYSTRVHDHAPFTSVHAPFAYVLESRQYSFSSNLNET